MEHVKRNPLNATTVGAASKLLVSGVWVQFDVERQSKNELTSYGQLKPKHVDDV